MDADSTTTEGGLPMKLILCIVALLGLILLGAVSMVWEDSKEERK